MFDGKRLRALREGAGLSQRELAERLDTDAGTVSDWETGKHKPRGYTRTKLAEAVGVPRSALDAEGDFGPIPQSLLEQLTEAFPRLDGASQAALLTLAQALAASVEYESAANAARVAYESVRARHEGEEREEGQQRRIGTSGRSSRGP